MKDFTVITGLDAKESVEYGIADHISGEVY